MTELDQLTQALGLLNDTEPPDEPDRQTLIDAWVLAKQAANRAYTLCSRIGEQLLADTSTETGYVASVSSRKIQVARNFEVEVLGAAGEEEFAAWCEQNALEPWEVKLSVSKPAREAVKQAVLDRGDLIPGVSAGYGAPYLKLGR